MKEIELLLNETKEYLSKYETSIVKQGKNFNIFTTINVTTDEVRHSRFLAELLNPLGSHGQENFFLNKFKKQILTIFDQEKNKSHFNLIDDETIFSNLSSVKIEYWTEEGRLDILIESLNRKKAIIIENKIYAEEGLIQLERYKNFGEIRYGRGNFIILYLTLDGKISRDESVGILEAGSDYFCISYKYEIVQFLESCLDVPSHLKVIIEHYIDLIKTLTMKEDPNDRIINLILKSKENFQSAQLISSQMKLAQNKIQKAFWIKLHKKMQAEFANKKSGLKNEAYADERNLFELIEPYPTLSVKREVEINSQKYHLSIAIQIGKGNIYFGFPDTKENKENKEYGDLDDTVQEKVRTHLADQSMKSDKWWLGWKYFSGHEINFLGHEEIGDDRIQDIAKNLNDSINDLEKYLAKI